MSKGDKELIAHVRLARSRSVGPVTFHKLIEKYGSAATTIDALLDGPNAHKILKQEAAVKEIDTAQASGMHILYTGSTNYPLRLAAIYDAPPILYWKGNPDLFKNRLCGIVGARNASSAGLKITRRIAADLGASNVTIASGLARGIDTAAHTASLATGTVACLAGGLDIIYPEENTSLYNDIAERGLLVSEMPPGTKPQARHFPKRNRIISGLSDGVLVIEAAAKSGSLITARFAAEQGRDLFAVPGSPLDPRSAGGNQLLKDGAVLTRNAEDILNELAEYSDSPAKPVAPVHWKKDIKHQAIKKTAKPEGGLLELLSPSPIHIDEIVTSSGMETNTVTAELQLLELEGKVTRHSGGRFSRIT